MSPQQAWYYVVTAVNQAGESDDSNQVSANIPGSWVYVYPGSYEDTLNGGDCGSGGICGAQGAAE